MSCATYSSVEDCDTDESLGVEGVARCKDVCTLGWDVDVEVTSLCRADIREMDTDWEVDVLETC